MRRGERLPPIRPNGHCRNSAVPEDVGEDRAVLSGRPFGCFTGSAQDAMAMIEAATEIGNSTDRVSKNSA
ncbi:hypothetical protein RSO01_82000 [Reyranella soli]|uniref:Uncharacterized protein n=1 Tax=Reyranella soli TaxID=1230389 RepID=A0A512NQ04_9HYPH|nr:hypothetical protein RSO01_82000 [Reyranella soli]